MKKLNLITKVILAFFAMVLVSGAVYEVANAFFFVNLDNYQSGELVYNYDGEEISCYINQDDLKELKSILKGVRFKDTPSCSFGTDVAITFFTEPGEGITLCPACDGCPLMQIGDSDCYIKIETAERSRFNAIVKKYGMVFPCV